ncbi:hypothetical protein HX804_04105 [Marine Group I thaumarchaeote]|uniref:Uncharacterized protein n=1 Tax=Marine Group I thaumarchaeote TaxID=2511932 RepID=A0A7K4NMQ5_9ARCH|nr:hypothetical protein [Marine Group I thaumarchaeote]
MNRDVLSVVGNTIKKEEDEMDYYHKLLLTGIISTEIMISHLIISH